MKWLSERWKRRSFQFPPIMVYLALTRTWPSRCPSSSQEVDLGIVADLGSLQRLPHIIGHGAACDLALTARSISSAEALRLGLVSQVTV